MATHTRGHALVVMLGYVIVQELARRWAGIDSTVQEGINELATLCAMEMRVNGQPRCNRIPEPRDSIQRLLAAADIRLSVRSTCLRATHRQTQTPLPDALACKGIKVATRKKLPENRITS